MSNLGILAHVQPFGYAPVQEGLDKIKRISDVLTRERVFALLHTHPLGFERQEGFLQSRAADFSPHCMSILESSRLVAYADGVDRFGLARTIVVFYDSDDHLSYIDIQKGISSGQTRLTREGSGDDERIKTLLGNGFTEIQPAGAYIPDDSP